ncbi:MAG: TolC family protein [Acidobacteriaceae bacterium]
MKTKNLQSGLAVGLMLLNVLVPVAGAQSQINTAQPTTASQQVPDAPAAATATLPSPPQPVPTSPYGLRPTSHDYSHGKPQLLDPIAQYTAAYVPPPRLNNSPRLDDLYRNGKIYLSLDDAILLALENNFDIAIARYNLDIADTDLLRARSGLSFLGVNTGLVTGTLGGNPGLTVAASPVTASSTSGGASGTTTTSTSSSSTVQTTGAVGGGPGGTSVGASGGASGPLGVNETTLGAGPLIAPPEPLDPYLTGTIQLGRAFTPTGSNFQTNSFSLNQNLDEYNFVYTQGFLPGETLAVTFDNSRTTNNVIFNFYSPTINTSFNAQVTQHLLQGFGWNTNGRYIYITRNNRRATDSSFRAQLLYTIDQIENIYWGLVGAYEDVQAKQGALQESTQILSDDKKQLQIGTLAPLDVVQANSQVASDQQALITAQTKLEYQQLIVKQAIARNLDDPIFAAAPVIPTDRVSLLQTPEEGKSTEELVQEAYANSPTIEQAILALKNQEITLKSVKNALLPLLDVYGFYGAAGLAGAQSPFITCNPKSFFNPCAGTPGAHIPYSTAFQNLFNSSGSNKGVGVNLQIPIRNRQAQAQQVRAQLEYRQSQMHLQQLYVQLRMQVTNQLYALQNDRAQVQSAEASQQYALQSLDAEQKKYHLGASTTALVLQQTRSVETAQDNLIAAQTTYAVDRAQLSQLVADTLDKYGISIAEAASGKITHTPLVPGLQAPQPEAKPQPLHPDQGPQGSAPSGSGTPAPGAAATPNGTATFTTPPATR